MQTMFAMDADIVLPIAAPHTSTGGDAGELAPDSNRLRWWGGISLLATIAKPLRKPKKTRNQRGQSKSSQNH